MKRALITGIAGQDGSYLAELLLAELGLSAWTDPALLVQHTSGTSAQVKASNVGSAADVG